MADILPINGGGLRLPGFDQRTAVVGRTGSGKTFASVWLLSTRDLLNRPWFMIDFKGDKLLQSLGAIPVDVRDKPPTRPGLYHVPVLPMGDEEAELNAFLDKVYYNQNTGIYFDEGMELGSARRRNPSVNRLMTQGRSRSIEMITCTQRPVDCIRTIFSEANHILYFDLTLPADLKTMSGYMGKGALPELPQYHSTWYDVDRNRRFTLAPVPSREALISSFHDKLSRRRKTI